MTGLGYIQYTFNNVFGVIMMSPNFRFLMVRGRATGKWSFPKGHGELRETPYECAIRELEEETGITIGNMRPTIGPVKLKAASYYVFRPSCEMDVKIHDTKEVTEVRWFSLYEIVELSSNIDVSEFLRRHGLVAKPPFYSRTPSRMHELSQHVEVTSTKKQKQKKHKSFFNQKQLPHFLKGVRHSLSSPHMEKMKSQSHHLIVLIY